MSDANGATAAQQSVDTAANGSEKLASSVITDGFYKDPNLRLPGNPNLTAATCMREDMHLYVVVVLTTFCKLLRVERDCRWEGVTPDKLKEFAAREAKRQNEIITLAQKKYKTQKKAFQRFETLNWWTLGLWGKYFPTPEVEAFPKLERPIGETEFGQGLLACVQQGHLNMRSLLVQEKQCQTVLMPTKKLANLCNNK